MSKKFKTWIISTIVLMVVINLFGFLYIKIAQYHAKTIFEQVKNNEKVYVYETYYGGLNNALYVEDVEDTTQLIQYYDKVAKLDTPAIINFDIKNIPIGLYSPLYVYKYFQKGSKVVEVIDFDYKCWGILKGYVYLSVIHKKLPPDFLIKQSDSILQKYNESKHAQMIKRIAHKISDYGWYCN